MSVMHGHQVPTTAETAQKQAMSPGDQAMLLARFAVYHELLSMQDVKNALESWQTAGNGKDFGAFLVSEDQLTRPELDRLIQAQNQYLQQQNATNDRDKATSVSPLNHSPKPTPASRPSNGAVKPKPAKMVNGHEPVDNPRQVARPAAKWPDVNGESAPGKSSASKPGLLQYSPGVDIQNLLQQTMELNASDLHLHSGACLSVRLHGEIREASPVVLSSKDCWNLIKEILTEPQLKRFWEKNQIDFAFDLPGVGRFRANAYKQQRGFDAVFRTIRPEPPTLAELGLPDSLERFIDFHQGLVLFTGPAGCGKSSTMAALVNLINQRQPDHILTIEDPIEYVHASARCNVTQREVGCQTESFARALRAALREDPDVIVIGELRDLETISLAITAAETGHLVLATLHTSSAIRTINRLLGVFPPDQQSQIRRMLSESLKAVVSQTLVKKADGKGQIAALEVLVNNNAIGNLIRENRTFQIKSTMQTGAAEGQRLLDTSLAELLSNRKIDITEALKHAEDPRNFE